jgi:ferrochelatase
MAATCDYQVQLEESSRMVAENCDVAHWQIVYQSRSGPPQVPWLEPDVCDVISELGASHAVQDVVVVPIGFISDHMEVLYDLDDEAAAAAEEAGINFVRAGTAGTHPKFVEMIRELIEERIADRPPRAVGQFGPRANQCAVDCCKYEPRRPAAST